MWKLVYASVAGTSHALSGAPCQDACAGDVHEREGASYLVACCSDGAGSAEHSEVGSKAASERFLGLAGEWISRAANDVRPTPEDVKAWVEGARASVMGEAETCGVVPREMACTLLGAVLGNGWAAFAQIGDGAIVFDGDEGYAVAFWPDSGEYANSTYFLTDEGFGERLRVEIVERNVQELAVFTDGLQMLALDFTNSKPHGPFFAPLFGTLRNGADTEKLRNSMAAFLDSKRINERTDDDKSLLLAARISDGDIHETTA